MTRRILAVTARAAAPLLVLAACSAESIVAPEPALSPPPPALVRTSVDQGLADLSGALADFGLDPASIDQIVGALGELLVCDPEPYAKTVKVVGRKGGTIKVGQHRLVIPTGALASDVEITAEVLTGFNNSVRFSPHGLAFSKPAALVMSYRNCDESKAAKKVAYTTEALTILELLPSADNSKALEVTTPLSHFSRYAVAW